LATKNSWMYTFPNKTRVAVTCAETAIEYLSETGILKLPNDCTVTTEFIVIRPHQEYKSAYKMNFTEKINNLTNSKNLFILSPNLTVPIKLSIRNDKTLSSLIRESETLQRIELKEPVSSPVYRQHLGIILLVINITLILVVILFLIIKCRKNRKSKITVEKPNIVSPVALNIIGSSQTLELSEATFPPPPPPLEPTTLYNYRK
jgi:hypothetical protein